MSDYLDNWKREVTENERLRAELAHEKAARDFDQCVLAEHEAAIAGVRELPGLNQTTLSVLAKAVLRALDGEQ